MNRFGRGPDDTEPTGDSDRRSRDVLLASARRPVPRSRPTRVAWLRAGQPTMRITCRPIDPSCSPEALAHLSRFSRGSSNHEQSILRRSYLSIVSIARRANRFTSALESDRALCNAGRASRALGPIPVRPIHALLRDPSSSDASSAMSAGTAGAASGPIAPMACAVNSLTRASESARAAMSASRHPRMSSFGLVGSYQPPAATFRNSATFRLIRTSGSASPRFSAGSADAPSCHS